MRVDFYCIFPPYPPHTRVKGDVCMTKSETLCRHAALAVLGGMTYNLIELIWRGRTHGSMFLAGGVCFELIGLIARRVRVPFVAKCGLCALAITAVEFVSGCVVNLWLNLAVWDYSHMRFHLKGQVCLLYSVFWLFISAAAMPLYIWAYGRSFRRRLAERS